jgi:glutamine amidotransferase
MAHLDERGFIDEFERLVIDRGVPYFGICLGMQFLAEASSEGGTHDGLGWISGTVSRIDPGSDQFRVPHMGWNDTEDQRDETVLFDGFNEGGTFYFVHSYTIALDRTDPVVTATTSHGAELVAAVRKENVFGVQFHPEKSQGSGLRVIENFVEFVNGGEQPS